MKKIGLFLVVMTLMAQLAIADLGHQGFGKKAMVESDFKEESSSFLTSLFPRCQDQGLKQSFQTVQYFSWR